MEGRLLGVELGRLLRALELCKQSGNKTQVQTCKGTVIFTPIANSGDKLQAVVEVKTKKEVSV